MYTINIHSKFTFILNSTFRITEVVILIRGFPSVKSLDPKTTSVVIFDVI